MPPRDALRLGRLPIHFFVFAVLSFAGAAAASPLVVGRIVDSFYRPDVLALVHTFTLGWITAAIMGVMYGWVPALTRHPLPRPGLARWQLGLFAIGTVGMVAHMRDGLWAGTSSSAALVVASAIMFAANMTQCLYRRVGRGAAETGMLLSICLLIVAGLLGLMLALNKSYDLLGAGAQADFVAHIQLAALGWATLAICAVSYGMLSALLPLKIAPPRFAIWQLRAVAGAMAALGVTALARWSGAVILSVAVGLSLLAYMVTMGRLVRSRRMAVDFTTGHAFAGCVWLVGAIAAGVALPIVGLQGETGNRLAAAYGALGLLGWISNFLIGMSYPLFPALVRHARAGLGWPRGSIAELSVTRTRAFVFVAFNAGVAITSAGFLLASVTAAEIGAAAIAAAGLVYSAVTLWTLGWAYRRSRRGPTSSTFAKTR